jgi:hypothetical protein
LGHWLLAFSSWLSAITVPPISRSA